MIGRLDPRAEVKRVETIEALPAILILARQAVAAAFDPADPDCEELTNLLDACMVGAHRLRLREKLRADERSDIP
jgi:hypothetical protein